MSDKKISQLDFSPILLNSIFPMVTLGVTTQTSFYNIITSLTQYYHDTYVTGGTFNAGTATFTNNTGGTFNMTGFTGSDSYWVSGASGTASVVQKNTTSTAFGNYSHAIGYNTHANGMYSHAEGYQSVAGADAAHAEGYGTQAGNYYSHAEGYGTIASGVASHAEGWGSISNSNYSHAEGYQTQASGNVSHSEGFQTIASGNQSHAEGNQTIANGTQSHAEGNNTTAIGNYSHAEGSGVAAWGAASHAEGYNSTANTATSHAEGYGTFAGGNSSHAEGYVTRAIGIYSHAEGNRTTASGNASHAEGGSTTASGSYSTASGYYTTASGYASSASGYGTLASGQTSHAEGYLSKAYGDFSHSQGYDTLALADNSHAEGYFSIAGGGSSHAEGSNTIANGSSSHAEGRNTLASGNYSHAEGYFSMATGSTSHAEGQGTTASGVNSHAEGNGSIASGTTSHAQGRNTLAGGTYSHAGGYNTQAYGLSSFVHGLNSVAAGYATSVLGDGITGTTDNTLYVNNLNIKSVSTATTSTVLGIDTNGNVISGNTNISDAIYTVNNNLNANNTTTATTSICIYGVNVFTGVTLTDLATKLPQPVTGKSVKIINNGLTTLSVFPSNIGGRVNNLPINTPALIPADGKLYEFICIVNPFPGIWTFTPPATAQYDSGEITISTTANTSEGLNPVITAYNPSYVGNTLSFNGSDYGYNGKNKSNIQQYNFGGSYYLSFRPDIPWLGIAKIKVYSNLVNDDELYTEIRVGASGESDYYSLLDGSLLKNGASSSNTIFRFYLDNKITGSATTATTIYTSANIGDNGTVWGEKVANIDSDSNVSFDATQGTFVGNKTLGNVAYPDSNTHDSTGNLISTGDDVELFYSSYISFQIQPLGSTNYGVIPNFKFRFVIEYYQ